MRSVETIICFIIPVEIIICLIIPVQFAKSLKYECFANNTIEVYNPDPSVFVHVAAQNSIGICVTQWDDVTHKVKVRITKCSKNNKILIDFASKTSSYIHGGKNTSYASFIIICNEIATDGVEKVAHNGVSAIIPAQMVNCVTPFFAITGHLYADNKKTTAVRLAHLGTKLYWVIQGPETYSLLPKMCRAYPDLFLENEMLQVIFSGCSQNKDLVSDFRKVGSSELWADLYVFRFQHSPSVILVCEVLVCPIGSQACNYKCTRGFRQVQRDVTNELNDKRTTTETVITHLTIETDKESNLTSASKECIPTVMFVMSTLLLQRVFYYAHGIVS
ncbi:hypothetical protein CHS0354_012095 [Potamilus streckersoni]|uniref:ZP-C domain-containing protein n=1 Tax=Potamilus streckersoni TaxID=2493646 RepID=A0AAE0SAD2_9BIVA|nr:hypothetical protein CHS0354_012095 [Potamilus streckersoni]